MGYYTRKSRGLVVLGGILLAVYVLRGRAQGSGGSAAKKSSASTTAKKKTTGKTTIIDVTGPKKRTYSKAELDAMQKRAKEAKRLKDMTPPSIQGDEIGTVSASPELEPSHGRTPAGYDPAQARAQARGIAAHLTKKGPRAYSPYKLAVWQTLAGIRADGNYGGSTRGALIYYGATEPPRPYVDPFATLPYHPPE